MLSIPKTRKNIYETIYSKLDKLTGCGLMKQYNTVIKKAFCNENKGK